MFNTKSTENAQEIHKLKLAVEELRGQHDRIDRTIRSSGAASPTYSKISNPQTRDKP